MAAPVLESGHKTAGANSTSVTVNKPDNVVEGDLLVAAVGGSFQLVGVPTGWTSVLGTDPGQVTLRVVYKIATDSEPASYTFTGLSSRYGAVIARITGHDPVNPIDVTAARNTDQTGDSSVEYPQITTTVADTLLIFAQTDNTQSFKTNSFSTATEVGSNGSAGLRETMAHRSQASAGLITQEINTMSHGGPWTAWCMSIKPAAASGGASVSRASLAAAAVNQAARTAAAVTTLDMTARGASAALRDARRGIAGGLGGGAEAQGRRAGLAAGEAGIAAATAAMGRRAANQNSDAAIGVSARSIGVKGAVGAAAAAIGRLSIAAMSTAIRTGRTISRAALAPSTAAAARRGGLSTARAALAATADIAAARASAAATAASVGIRSAAEAIVARFAAARAAIAAAATSVFKPEQTAAPVQIAGEAIFDTAITGAAVFDTVIEGEMEIAA